MNYGAQEKLQVGALHFELPSGEVSSNRSETGGTLHSGEIQSEDPTTREIIPLYEGQTLKVGRGRANDLVIENSSVSRMHAVFSASRTGIVLIDLSSLNGTFLNNKRIGTPVDLSAGDNVRIGNVKIGIELIRSSSQSEEEESVVDTRTASMASSMVTVLVADICNYAKMSQALPAEDIADMLNRWFERVVDTVLGEGGEIDKYIGDCVMCLWRTSKEGVGEGAVRAVLAAEEILRETALLRENAQWKHNAEYPWNCRVAINSGEALVGAMGGAGSREYTALGDTVNVAFRLENLASREGSSLVMTEATAGLVSDQLPVLSLGQVILEGRKDNIHIYTLDRDA